MEGVVTALKVNSRKPNRVDIFLDGSLAFQLLKTFAAELRLGQQLTAGEIQKLRLKDRMEEMIRSRLSA